MKKFALLLFAFSFLLFSEEIKSYKIQNTINSDASVYIKEQIEYSFDGLKHGIYRDIPLQIKVNSKIKTLKFKLDYVLLDEKEVEYSTKFFTSSNGKNVRIKIGSKDRLIKGTHTYTIAYKLSNIVIPNCLEGKDCISLNSVGNSWRVPINNIQALYYLPPILASYVEVKTYTGKFGSKSSNATLNWLDSLTLEVKVAHLEPFEGLTTTFIYPTGLIKDNSSSNFLSYWYIIFFLGVGGYLYTLYKKFTSFRDNRSIAPMYEPLKDISVLEAGLILDSSANNKDYAAAIIELATKGYIKIHKTPNGTILEKINKDPSSLPADLREFYTLLFENEDKFILDNSPSTAARFEEIFNKVNEILYEESIKKGYFKEKPYDSKRSFLFKALLGVGAFILYSIYWVIKNYGVDMAIFLIFPFVFSIVAISIYTNASSITEKLLGVFFFAIAIAITYLGHFDDINSFLEFVISPVGFSFILILATIFIYNNVAKYTQKGAYVKTHLLGLKEFITRVKEDEIKRRLQSDPLYLEKLLPYAILFEVTNHWIELFTKFGISTPMWYDGDIDDLGSFDREFTSSANHSEDIDSSSSFGGGGFSSGGGAGGGGGGSW